MSKFVWNDETVLMDGELYDKNKQTYRFCLRGAGEKPLVIIGLNPSTADNKKPDPTMNRVIDFVESNGFEGFLMINLFPLRTPSPEILRQLGFDAEIHQENLNKIDSYLSEIKQATILLAFGESITQIKFLKQCFADIVSVCKKHNANFTCLATTKNGHPRHPLYLKKDLRLKNFDIDLYLEGLKLQ